jgi:hypothetical protein
MRGKRKALLGCSPFHTVLCVSSVLAAAAAMQEEVAAVAHTFRNGGAICFDETKAINATQRSATTIRGSNSERNCFS